MLTSTDGRVRNMTMMDGGGAADLVDAPDFTQFRPLAGKSKSAQTRGIL